MNVIDAIKTRRTIRTFDKKKVPPDVLKDLIEAARWAPSGHNLQPWKFVIIDKEDIIKKLAAVINKKGDELIIGFNTIMRDVSRKLENVPAVILVYGTGSVMKMFENYGDEYKRIGALFEVQSISAAIQNILLCAHSKSLGVGWFGMAVFCEKEINESLGVEGNLQAILAVGYPSNDKVNSLKRKKIDEITTYLK